MKNAEVNIADAIQILLWYDQAEIALFKLGLNEFIIAVASGASANEDDTFVGASVTLGFLADYQNGKFDLRFALAHANLRRYWQFTYTGYEKKVYLKKVKRSSAIVMDSVPEAGFFSRDHHAIELVKKFVPDTTETFHVDGSWELGEFSKLYGNLEDVYYIFNDIRRFQDAATSDATRQAISKAMDRPWQGGGSYVGYYYNIANDNAPEAKLQVSGIKYNSPGFVSVKAKKLAFDDVIALLQAYAHRKPEVRKAYNALYRVMSQNKLLKREAFKGFVSPEIRQVVVDRANDLDEFMPGISFDTFTVMAKGDVIVGAKVILSVFRRMEKLYKFFEEGRVSYEGIDTDPMADDELVVL